MAAFIDIKVSILFNRPFLGMLKITLEIVNFVSDNALEICLSLNDKNKNTAWDIYIC